MRAFVTGAAGFAGSYLVELLLTQGAEVFGLVLERDAVENLAPCLASPAASRLHLLEGDLLDPACLREGLRTARPDHVYHLAAAASVRQSLENPREALRVNLLGTQAILEAVRQAPGRPRVLCVSSAEAYGESARDPAPLTEGRPLLPVTPYGCSKAGAEQLVCRYVAEHGLDVVRVRPFPHTGARQSPQFALPDWARQLAEIEAGRCAPRLRVGNLAVRRDLSDVRDVVVAYAAAAARGESGGVYNICSGRAVSLRDALHILMGLTHLSVEVVPVDERQRRQDIEVLAGSSGALAARTGWGPTIPLPQTLRDLLGHWRDRTGRRETGATDPWR